MAARRRAVADAAAARAAGEVARALAREPALVAARRVALYAAVGGELPTRPVFEELGGGAEILLPRVRGGALEWARAGDWDALGPGSLGVPEPPGPAQPAPGPGDWVLLPGLAFDREGWRLGRGAGHYDRAFPPGRPSPQLVGLAFAFQVVEAVPHDSRDRRVDAIVTERGWMRRREAE